jgi:hypothetical protein
MNQKTDPKFIEDAEIDSIVKSNWNCNVSIDANLRSIARASVSYGQRRLIAEGWKRLYSS